MTDLHTLANAISDQSPAIKAFAVAVADKLEPVTPPPPPPPPGGGTFADFVGTVSSDLALATAKGIRQVRIDIGFISKGEVDANPSVHVVPIAAYNPWSDLRPSGTGDHYAPDTGAHRDEWARRMMTQKIVPTFTTPPKAIEVWNEPWLQGFWNQGPNAVDFLNLCRRFAAVCWATPGYANTLILVSADSGYNGWVDRLVAADTTGFLKDPRIAPTAHPYCSHASPGAHSSTTQAQKDYDFDRWKFTYDAFKAHGHPDPKVWLTEFGWISQTPGGNGDANQSVTEANQAQYMVDAYKIAKASGKVAKAYAYMLSPNQSWSYNWLRPDNSEKPVVPAVRALVAT